MDKIIGKEIGGCLIESRIGQGGMGIVYKAHHLALDIPVALKLLNPLMPDSGDIDRFLREARVTARLRHPNIVGILNVGTEDDRHFIIMEFIEGCNLLTLVRREGKMSVLRGVEIACQALDALDCMFKNSIVHRDIKPENILIDGDGNVKLTDCGLARIMNSTTITQPSIIIGSPHYIAPEQAENARGADHRADIYSLGCTLFHILAGKPPFEGEAPIQIVLEHLRKEPPVLHDVEPSAPALLSFAVRKMMDKLPENRPQTPLEAKEELLAALSTGGVSGRTTKIFNAEITAPKKKFPLTSVVAGAVGAAILTCALVVLLGLTGRKSIADLPQASPSQAPIRAKESPDRQHGGPVNQDYALIKEIQKGNVERVQAMLAQGFDPNAGDIPPLVIAVQSNSEFIGHVLLEKGANPNHTDPSGRTALHYALHAKNTSFVRLLLVSGADPNKLDPTEKKPLELVHDPAIEELLRKYGAR